jgi:DNA polymerase III delta subunit
MHASDAATAAGRDQLIATLLAAARTLPMMAARRVIVVHDAERLLSPRKGKEDEAEAPADDTGKKRKRGTTPVEELEAYIAEPEPLTTVVFVAGAVDANRRLVKLLRKHAVVVDCGTLSNTADAAKWVRARLAQDGLTIEPQAISLLLDGTGLSLSRIRAESEKLALFAAGERTITPQHVREIVRPDGDEPGEGFPMGNAIWSGNARAALREVSAQFDKGFSEFQILGQIRAAARGIKPEDRARRALGEVLKTDLALKSHEREGKVRYLIERLAIELCQR